MKKNTSTENEESSFYCPKKKCRKTAWDTPEYLTAEDWNTLEKVIGISERRDPMELYRFVSTDSNSRAFFNRVIGWPEGYSYCLKIGYCEFQSKQGFMKHTLEKAKMALSQNKS